MRNRLLRIVPFVIIAPIAVCVSALFVAGAYEMISRRSGATSKDIPELALIFAVAIFMLKWTRDAWRALR